MKRILITGGCGFVGANLVRELLPKGDYELTLLDDFSNAVPENIETVRREVEVGLRRTLAAPDLIAGDIGDAAGCEAAVRGHDAVVHLAAYTRVVESIENPSRCFDVNMQGTINLLEACRKHDVKSFVFASSNAAVGEFDGAISEQNPAHPLSPYGAAKLAGEALCSAYFHSYGIQTVALRFTNAYGPYCQKKSSVVAKFMRELMEGRSLTVFGDGSQTRDFVHVSDLCRAIRMSLSAVEAGPSELGGEVFQVATGGETSVLDLIALLADATGTTPKVVMEPARTGEIARNRSNITKARERLGFTAEIGLRQGIEELYRWFCDQGESAARVPVLAKF